MKRYSTSLIIREVQIKTTVRFTIKKDVSYQKKRKREIDGGEDMEELEPLGTVGRSIKLCSLYGK